MCLLGLITIMGIYLMRNLTLSIFKNGGRGETLAVLPEEVDFDKKESGIPLRTGLIDARGPMETLINCPNSHYSKPVSQNRMSKELWVATTRWMQGTQNLWDLGKYEAFIIHYLVENYPQRKTERRENLNNIQWYD